METPFTDNDLDIWVKNGYNVLFEGNHGTGKSARILDCFKKHGLKFKYFSCPTLDPWVDFVGIPTIKTGPNGEYIDIVQPREFSDDSIECIFLDEFNRAKSKVKNATMEIIQFKSINGRVFKNLKFVWAAINPESKTEEDELKYDVEKLDPALRDRFQIHVSVPNAPCEKYFHNKFGKVQGGGAISWWASLDTNVQQLVSPRRLEYALIDLNNNGNPRFILPASSNISSFLTYVMGGSLSDQLKSLYQSKNITDTKQFIDNTKNILSVLKVIEDNEDYVNWFLPHVSKENIMSKVLTSDNIFEYIIKNYFDFITPIDSMFAESGEALINKLKDHNPVRLSKMAASLDFSNFHFRRVLDYKKGTTTKTSFDISTLTNKTIKLDPIKVIDDLISLDMSREINDKQVRICFDYLVNVLGNGDRLKFKAGTGTLFGRICRRLIESGENAGDLINNSNQLVKEMALKNLFLYI